MHTKSVKSLLTWTCQHLKESASPRLDAEVLMAYVLGISRSALIARVEETLPPALVTEFEKLILRRSLGEPVAYLLQEKEFWSLPFKVTKDTLIPRPETECLAEAVLQHLPPNKPQTIADLGTGAGAIALALASERPHWKLIATEVSKKALEVAKENAKQLKVFNVLFKQGHWLDVISENLDAIVSNPPYIAENDPHLLGDGICFEPKEALVASENGLAALKEIIQKAPNHLKPGGYLFLEHGLGQALSLKAVLEKAGFLGIKSIQDYAGIERVMVARY